MTINLEPKTSQEYFDLARRYDNGTGVNQDKEAAIHWFRRAAELGHAEAQAEMGWRLFRRDGVQRNNEEMVRYYREAAEQGNPRGMGELGRCYFLGLGVAKDLSEAVRLYRLAGEKGYHKASQSLASCYRRGLGVPQNDEEAAKWDELGWEQQRTASFNDNREYIKQTPSGPGAAKAMGLMGKYYAYGFGTQQDFEQAKIWYLKSAEEDYGYAKHALFNLATLYVREWGELDTGDFRNLEEGIKYLRLAAERGHAEAMLRLGLCYADGFGVPQNDEEAVRLFRVLAEENVPEAMFRLGLCYDEGKGVLQDENAARHWIEKAADCGAGYDEAKERLKQNEMK